VLQLEGQRGSASPRALQFEVCACSFLVVGDALIMGSVFGHTSAVNIINKCQKLVTWTKSSHKLKHWVHEEYETLKKSSPTEDGPQHKKLTWLVQAATTRFSYTYNCMLSVQQM